MFGYIWDATWIHFLFRMDTIWLYLDKNLNLDINQESFVLQKTRKRLRKRAEASTLQVLSKSGGSSNKIVTKVVSNGHSQGGATQPISISHAGEPAILTIKEAETTTATAQESVSAITKVNTFDRCIFTPKYIRYIFRRCLASAPLNSTFLFFLSVTSHVIFFSFLSSFLIP